jgi:5-methylcytosine-specific restriction endonuclease McrA
MTITIGEQQFKTQKVFKEYLKTIWIKHENKVISHNTFPEVHKMLSHVLMRHPLLFDEKPIEFLAIKGQYKEMAWMYKLHNTTLEKFSMLKCISGKDKTEHNQRNDILRKLIEHDTLHFVKSNERKCSVCSIYEGEVDHIIPFCELVQTFLVTEHNKYPNIMIKNKEKVFTDEGFMSRWKSYHCKHAKLQFLCKPCHRIKTNQQMMYKSS